MTVIGITGPTGAGKTSALDALKRLDFLVIDCDALYYALLAQDVSLREALKTTFGQIFLPDGRLDRKTFGERVFHDPKELAKLNRIVYPAMRSAVENKIENCSQKGVAIDAINLIESKLGELCDFTVALVADPAIRMKRIMARDGITEERAKARIAAQKSDSFYRKNCTFTLENCAGCKAEFDKLIYEFFEGLLEE